MVADEDGDDYQETAIGYALSVLSYMQNGGKLSSIEATASEIVRLAGRELEQRMPGPMKAQVLMESVEEMRLRHNSLNADEVFSDMMSQARNAGRLRNSERQDMENFEDNAADVVTALENGKFIAGANPAADHIAEAVKKYGKWVVLGAAEAIRTWPDEFPGIPADKVMEFLEESYLHAGASVAHALETYAKDAGDHTELGRLYDALDKAGGVDRFDWGSYADDGMTPTIGLHFVQMPALAGENAVFIFGS